MREGEQHLEKLLEESGCNRDLPKNWLEAGDSWTATHYRTYDLLTTDNDYSRFLKKYLVYRNGNIDKRKVSSADDVYRISKFGGSFWRNLNGTYLTEPGLIKRGTLDKIFVDLRFQSILHLDPKGWVSFPIVNKKYKHWVQYPPSIDQIPDDDDEMLLYLLDIRQKTMRGDTEHQEPWLHRLALDYSLITEAKAIKSLSKDRQALDRDM